MPETFLVDKPETFLKSLKVTNKFEKHIIYNNFFYKILRKRLHSVKSLDRGSFKGKK